MICPEDGQPCTYDHSKACFERCRPNKPGLIDTQGLIDGMQPDDPWTPMSGGSRYYYLRPEPDQFTSSDAVIAMSRIHRFNGHGEVKPLDLNQHHILVGILALLEEADLGTFVRALTHDIHEIFVHDVARPMKHAMRVLMDQQVREILKANGVEVPLIPTDLALIKTPYDLIESMHAEVVWAKYGQSDWDVDVNLVKRCDNWALAIESQRMFGSSLGLELPRFEPVILDPVLAQSTMAACLNLIDNGLPEQAGDVLWQHWSAPKEVGR